MKTVELTAVRAEPRLASERRAINQCHLKGDRVRRQCDRGLLQDDLLRHLVQGAFITAGAFGAAVMGEVGLLVLPLIGN